MTKIYQNKLC